MIIQQNGRVRLTKDEFNRLRTYAARTGFVVEAIEDIGDLIEALILGLSADRAEHMLEFIASRESVFAQKGCPTERDDG